MYNKNNSCSNIIVLIWWAFQWKSLIALKLASKLDYSWVISTDFIRNTLRIIDPVPEILCSTSNMDTKVFLVQRNKISDFLYKLLPFYTERQEKIILEGIHFSKDFLIYLKNNWAKCFGLNNTLTWKEKVVKKLITTPITRLNKNSGQILDYCKNKEDYNKISYLEKEEKYIFFHKIILSELKELNIDIINYNDLSNAIDDILNSLDKS